MAGPSLPLDLGGSLAELQAILDVVCGIPVAITADERAPGFHFQVGAEPDNSLARVEYQILSIVALGQDELRADYDPGLTIPGDTYQPNPAAPLERLGGVVQSVRGQRVVTVQIKAETLSSAGGGAFAIAERIRTRLGLPTIADRLESAGVGLIDCGATRPTDYTNENGHTVCVAWFEADFAAADTATDDPVTTIEQTEPEQE